MGWGAVRGDITHSDLQSLAGSADEPLLLPLRGRRMQFLRETVLKARRHGPVSSGKEGDGFELSAVGGATQKSSELPVSGSIQTEHDSNLSVQGPF